MYKVKVRPKVSALTKQISNEFGLPLIEECGENIIRIPGEKEEGKLRSISSDFGVGLLLLECEIIRPLRVEIIGESPNPLQFHFCLRGKVEGTLLASEQTYKLTSLNTVIIVNAGSSEQFVTFPGDQKLVYCYLEIDRKEFYDVTGCKPSGISGKLHSLLERPEEDIPYLHLMTIDIDLSQKIMQIQSLMFEGLIKRAFLESQLLELFYRLILLYNKSLDNKDSKYSFSSYDMEQINKAKSIIEESYQESPTIGELAKMVGLNEQKLKAGFKHIYGSPVKTYLRNYKLDLAKELLSKGTYTITQVVEEIGYKNRGYFSRIFKDKYGVLPKDYLKSLKSASSE